MSPLRLGSCLKPGVNPQIPLETAVRTLRTALMQSMGHAHIATRMVYVQISPAKSLNQVCPCRRIYRLVCRGAMTASNAFGHVSGGTRSELSR